MNCTLGVGFAPANGLRTRSRHRGGDDPRPRLRLSPLTRDSAGFAAPSTVCSRHHTFGGLLMSSTLLTTTIDARGQSCPGPLVSLARALKEATSGDLLELL